MVFGDEIEQHGDLLLHAGIKFLASEGLIDLSDGTLERVVFLVAEESAATEFLTESLDGFHGTLVGGMKPILLSGLLYRQALIVVVVERIKSVGLVHHDVEQSLVLVVLFQLLGLNSTAYHLDQLAKFGDLLTANTVIDSIALDEVVLKYTVSPFPKLYATIALHTIAD